MSVQETLDEALISPAVPRVFAHIECGGWVIWSVAGGFCTRCHAGPLPPSEYQKPGGAS